MRIRRGFAKGILIALAISLVPTVAISAQKIIPGSKCKVVKQKVNYLDKTYTCIKSGKKLIWNNGVVVDKPISVPNPQPSPTPPPIPFTIDLSLDSRITPRAELSKNELCKTRDLSYRTDTSNGFPRPAGALISPSSVKILILPVHLPDVPFLESDLAKLKNATEETAAIYKRISFGKLNIEFTYPEKSEWVTLSRSAASYGLIDNKPQQNNEIVVIDAITASSAKINFDLYAGILIETGHFKSTGGGQGFPGQRYATGHGTAKGVSFEFGSAVGVWQTIAHEIGHSLFALEDLYIFLNSNRPSVLDPNPAGPWDMMSNSKPDFFGWNKLLMGFLADEDFRCISSQSDTVHHISNIDSMSGNRLVLINLSEGRTLALEGRTSVDGNQGLLVYEIDSSVNHGDGPIKSQKALIENSQPVSLIGYKLEVLERNRNGLLVRVTK